MNFSRHTKKQSKAKTDSHKNHDASVNQWCSRLRFRWTKKVPLIMQSETSECGIACLAMISQFYGKYIQLRELRSVMPASQQGLSLQQIIKYAATLDLTSRPLKLELEEINELQLPTILHWNFCHFVVLTKVSKTYIIVHNPAVGEEKLSLSAASKCFTGIALELSPNHQFTRSKTSSSLTLWDFTRPIRGISSQLLLLLGLSVLIQIFALASPLYMQTVIDSVVDTGSVSLLTSLAMGFALLLIIDSVTHFLRDVVILRFSHMFNLHVSNSVLGHLLRLPMTYFQNRHMGDIVSRFASLQPVREILTKGLVSALVDGLLSVATLIVMFVYSAKLAVIVLTIVSIYSIGRWLFFYPVKQLNQQILQSDATQQSYFMQSVRAIRTIKLAASEARTQSKWLNYFVDNANQRIQLGQWNISFVLVNKLLFGIENLIVVYVAATLVMQQQFSVGMLFAFMSYKGRFVSASSSLIAQWIEYKILNVHLSRIEDIVHHKTESTENFEDRLAKQAQHKVLEQHKTKQRGASLQVENLAYRHHKTQAFLFEKLYLVLNSGDYIAIIGASGCGKTSLLHCLLGLNDAAVGTVMINNLPLNTQTRSHHRIAAVMQDDQLLSGSIKDNICQFAEHINVPNMMAAAQLACIEQDIMAMTMQYETLIGDMGASLSGGQKQRILLARALYQQPELLILDEATSHLDVNTEAQVCANLKRLNTTIIMVAHRPQTIATAKRIYTLSPLGLTEISYPSDNPPTKTKDNKEDPYVN